MSEPITLELLNASGSFPDLYRQWVESQMTTIFQSLQVPAHILNPDPIEEAFWAEIVQKPDDRLPRLVYADWLEEHGRWKEGRALRETADRVPKYHRNDGTYGTYGWYYRTPDEEVARDSGWPIDPEDVPMEVWMKLKVQKANGWERWKDYPRTTWAIQDLVRAWVVVYGGGWS